MHPRRFTRTPISQPLTFSPDEDGSVDALGRDISLGGMFIATACPAAFNAEVSIHLSLPGIEGRFILPAIVRWTRADGMGVHFPSLGVRETDPITGSSTVISPSVAAERSSPDARLARAYVVRGASAKTCAGAAQLQRRKRARSSACPATSYRRAPRGRTPFAWSLRAPGARAVVSCAVRGSARARLRRAPTRALRLCYAAAEQTQRSTIPV